MDTGAAFTGGAGNDTFNATVATLGALDVVDAGAGTDTLSVVETNSITTWGDAKLTGFETATVSTTGSIGSIANTSVNKAAVPQVASVSLTKTFATNDTIKVTIAGNAEFTATVGSTTNTTTGGRAEAMDAIKAVLTAQLGDSVSFDSYTTGSGQTPTNTKMNITSAVAGNALPTISLAKVSVADSTASVGFASATTAQSATVGAGTVTANVTQTGSVAIKQTASIVISSATAATTAVFSVNGAEYTAKFASTGDTTVVAASVGALINSVLGAGSATVSSSTVTLTALTAGTPLPAMNLRILNSSSPVSSAATDTWSYLTGNATVTPAASTAVALAAPSGVTSYTAAATGVANVSGAATTDITASGTVVQTSVGKDVKVTATDSVFVSGAKGTVTIGAGKSTTTIIGSVASDTGSTSGDAAGVYVTGGTTVTITGNKDTGNVKVGAAPYAKAAVSTTAYPESNGNSSKTPTGDVSITNVSRTADTTTGESIGTYGTGTAGVYTNGATTVTVKGAGTTTITDANTQTLKATAEATAVAGTSKLATVNLAGLSGNAAIKSDAISTISVADTLTDQTVTVNNSGTTGANTGAISLQVSNVGSTSTRLTLDNATATSVNVSSGAASSYATIGSTASNSGSKSYITLTTPKATSVTMTNSLAVDIGDTTAAGMAKVATINASGATGSVAATIGNTSAYGLTFTGGSAADTVTLKASSTIAASAQDGVTVKTSINLGAGNDNLLNGGTAASNSATVSSGAVVDGGEGSDTVSASLVSADSAAQFTNFETVDVAGAAASGSLDVSLLTGSTITGVAVTGDIGSAGAFSVTKIKGTDVGVTVTDTGTTAGSLTATLATSTGTADTATVVFNAISSATSTTSILTLLKTTGIETVSVASGGALATATAKVANEIGTFEDSSNTTTTITITGTQKFTLGAVEQSKTNAVAPIADITAALKTIDGSAATGALVITAGSDTANVTSTNFDVKFTGLTIKGGAGDDTLRNDAAGGVVNGGAGADGITLTGAATSAGVKASADGGDGDDTITVGAAVSTTLTGGAGKDTFVATAAVSSTTGNVITTIADYVLGTDTIKIEGSNSLAKATTTTGTYAQLLAAADTQAEGNAKAVWFNFDGNTYVVGDTATSDVAVVKLVGSYNLTSAAAVTGLIGEA